MRLKKVRISEFRRFTDLTIDGLGESTRLVVLVGPNGGGKSSLFDAFRVWHAQHGASLSFDSAYHSKGGESNRKTDVWQKVHVDFYEPIPEGRSNQRKLFYIRSAYRHEPRFLLSSINRQGDVLDGPRVEKMIDSDQTVSNNYARLVSQSVDGVFVGDTSKSVGELRDELLGPLRDATRRVFDDLTLAGVGDPMKNGSFYFDKGSTSNFLYMNLSGGEKAVFDLLLDIVIKTREFDDTIICIDEPDSHMHTRLQAKLLGELFRLVPGKCQLWISTHSIGMLRKAKELAEKETSAVAVLDFHDNDFDQAVTIYPSKITRSFWKKTLSVALDDLATLVAPSVIVVCEGGTKGKGSTRNSEFDARCYRAIFRDESIDVEFLSVGNASEVMNESGFQAIAPGTKVIRIVDRDDLSAEEIAERAENGVRVLSRRHIESYLLDDGVLTKLCETKERPEVASALLHAKQIEISRSVERGNPPDDVKSAAGEIYNAAKKLLNAAQMGGDAQAFMRDTLAPLLVPGMDAYEELKNDILTDQISS